LRRVGVESGLAVGALTTGDVTIGALTQSSLNKYRVTSVDLTYAISDLAALIDDNFQFGIAYGDYTSAEVEECLESASSIDIGNKIEREQANRLVRHIGSISGNQVTVGAGLTFNDGRSMRTKLNWLIGIGDVLNLWVRNGSGVTYTGGSILKAQGVMWVTP